MKKTVKKLVLAKETVRSLEKVDDLKYVAGGFRNVKPSETECPDDSRIMCW